MDWWKKPFTIILVPHDGSETRSFSVNQRIFLFVSLFLLFLFGTIIISFLSFTSSDQAKFKEKINQKTASLQQERKEKQKLEQTVQSLQNQIEKTNRLQKSILKISGFSKFKLPDDRKGGNENNKNLSKRSQSPPEVKKQLTEQIEKNRKLTRIKKFVKSRNKVLQKTPMLWPSEGWLSSPYGYRSDPMGGKGRSFHEGVDVAAWHGSPVRATAEGKVLSVERKEGYGKIVKLKHEFGYKTIFAHLSKILVQENQSVDKGQIIARVGNSGHSTGSHVHYEIRVNGEPINPWPYLVQHFETFKNNRKDNLK